MNRIEFNYKNVLLKGVIIERSAFLVKVQLLSPFKAWETFSMISGMCRGTPNHFLTEQGDKTIKYLLINSYKKFKTINDNFDRVSKNYIDLQVELKSLKHISDNKKRSTVKSKLEDWFYDSIFTSRITGLIASYNDRKYIFEIIENRLKQKGAIKKWEDYVEHKNFKDTFSLN